MKVITPEIAWHETLPIYSCDLQILPDQSQLRSTDREPLSELSISDLPVDNGKPDTSKRNGESKENEQARESWTRMATAGGDNMVRLWRVNLEWSPPSSVTVVAPTKPLSKGLLASDKEPSGKQKKAAMGAPKVSAAVSDGLVFLATLKRHERLVNVVRWSPSGTSLFFFRKTFEFLSRCILCSHKNKKQIQMTFMVHTHHCLAREPIRSTIYSLASNP